MRGRSRTLMADGKWLLEPGEPAPELAEPAAEKPGERRMASLGPLRQRKAERTPMGLGLAHGTASMYANAKCRCRACTLAHSAANREWEKRVAG